MGTKGRKPRPRKALQLWKDSGRTLTFLAQVVERHPGSVKRVLYARCATVTEGTRLLYERAFKLHGVPIEGMWDIDEDYVACLRAIPKHLRDEPETPAPPEEEEEESPVIITREYLTPAELKHFGMTDDPFDDIETIRSYTNDVTRFIERRIERAMLNRTIVAIVGEVGSGKSTMLRRLYERLTDRQVKFCSPAAIDRSRITEASLVSAMLRDLGTDDPGYSMSSEKRSQNLRELLEQLNVSGVVPVLAIDEAHDLPDKALIALKRIWDSYTTYRLLSVVMVGQLSLARRLRGNMALRELAGRTDLNELPPMTPDEAYEYVAHRFAVRRQDVGKVFAPDAFTSLREGLPTYPLWINTISVRAMRVARQLGDELVTRDHVARA